MKRILTVLCIAFSITLLFAGDKDWKLERERDGIKIFNRFVVNSKMKEYKGEIVIKKNVQTVLKAFTDIKNHDKFLYKCKKGSVKLVKKVSDNDFYTYMEIETPWPVSHRDIVTRYIVNKPESNGTITIDLSCHKDLVPEVKGIVRVPLMSGYWKLIPVDKNSTKVIHQAYSSPGGNIPEGLANSASVDAPFAMLKSLSTIDL
jgi:hypothetical protein